MKKFLTFLFSFLCLAVLIFNFVFALYVLQDAEHFNVNPQNYRVVAKLYLQFCTHLSSALLILMAGVVFLTSVIKKTNFSNWVKYTYEEYKAKRDEEKAKQNEKRKEKLKTELEKLEKTE